MNLQVRDYFLGKGSGFQAVRFLNEEKDLKWIEALKMDVPKAWYELSRVSSEDRLEFVRESWLRNLSFHPKATPEIENFFDQLDDVGILVTRGDEEDPWRPEMVYSLADNSTFFRGLVPATDEEIEEGKERLEIDLPADFWAFAGLHNGFGRLSDLGVLMLGEMEETRGRLVKSILSTEKPLRMGKEWVDPKSLFPFYEEYGLGSFQCFNASWYPGSEMGNVHFSGIDYTLSDTLERSEWADQLAFPTFLEWLAAFLEGMNSCI
jgi:hypothetical protein